MLEAQGEALMWNTPDSATAAWGYLRAPHLLCGVLMGGGSSMRIQEDESRYVGYMRACRDLVP